MEHDPVRGDCILPGATRADGWPGKCLRPAIGLPAPANARASGCASTRALYMGTEKAFRTGLTAVGRSVFGADSHDKTVVAGPAAAGLQRQACSRRACGQRAAAATTAEWSLDQAIALANRCRTSSPGGRSRGASRTGWPRGALEGRDHRTHCGGQRMPLQPELHTSPRAIVPLVSRRSGRAAARVCPGEGCRPGEPCGRRGLRPARACAPGEGLAPARLGTRHGLRREGRARGLGAARPGTAKRMVCVTEYKPWRSRS